MLQVRDVTSTFWLLLLRLLIQVVVVIVDVVCLIDSIVLHVFWVSLQELFKSLSSLELAENLSWSDESTGFVLYPRSFTDFFEDIKNF